MIGMGVGVDDVPDRQTVACRGGAIVIDQLDLGIDQRSRTCRRTADDIGATAADGKLFENHPRLPGRAESSSPRRLRQAYEPIEGRSVPAVSRNARSEERRVGK